MNKNPYIEPENYFEPYSESINKLKDNPEALELDNLCYAVFKRNEDGAKLMELFNERYIYPSLVPIGSKNYESLLTYFEGFKHAFRMIKTCIESHEQRIKAGKNG